MDTKSQALKTVWQSHTCQALIEIVAKGQALKTSKSSVDPTTNNQLHSTFPSSMLWIQEMSFSWFAPTHPSLNIRRMVFQRLVVRFTNPTCESACGLVMIQLPATNRTHATNHASYFHMILCLKAFEAFLQVLTQLIVLKYRTTSTIGINPRPSANRRPQFRIIPKRKHWGRDVDHL